MSFFPTLDARALPDLIALFQSDPLAHGVEPDEAGLFLDEVAVAIAKRGVDGAVFLLDYLVRADTQRAGAILLGLAFVDQDSGRRYLPRIRSVLASFLACSTPSLVAEAVGSSSALGFADMADSITPLLNHESPYVVGSVLRFLSRHFPSRARPILMNALRSPEPVVRANAIDELDNMECKEALPRIVELLNDPHENVRAAANWAAEHLGAQRFVMRHPPLSWRITYCEGISNHVDRDPSLRCPPRPALDRRPRLRAKRRAQGAGRARCPRRQAAARGRRHLCRPGRRHGGARLRRWLRDHQLPRRRRRRQDRLPDHHEVRPARRRALRRGARRRRQGRRHRPHQAPAQESRPKVSRRDHRRQRSGSRGRLDAGDGQPATARHRLHAHRHVRHGLRHASLSVPGRAHHRVQRLHPDRHVHQSRLVRRSPVQHEGRVDRHQWPRLGGAGQARRDELRGRLRDLDQPGEELHGPSAPASTPTTRASAPSSVPGWRTLASARSSSRRFSRNRTSSAAVSIRKTR